jgi:predicted ArsR family transcriptional regulator
MDRSALDTIADPTRLEIVRRLSEGGPASLPELALAAGVHLNTARAHVSALEAAGLVLAEQHSAGARGRPRLRYRLSDDYTLPTSDFRGLAELLAAALVRSGQEPAELRRLGRDWGRYLAGRPGSHDIDHDLPAALERLGFQARVEGGELLLTACPCRLVLPDRPELLCGLAMAVAEGVLAGSGIGTRLTGVAHDPVARHCKATIEELAS